MLYSHILSKGKMLSKMHRNTSGVLMHLLAVIFTSRHHTNFIKKSEGVLNFVRKYSVLSFV